ncbi:hypothetical protein ABZ281_28610 [Streptomyces sp. NPDC006265]|uniref:hypothetical protein n=1 Tax=Streptomyces sp. NPDC006265 TaxID=3156740 RepID=UPI0033BD9A5F
MRPRDIFGHVFALESLIAGVVFVLLGYAAVRRRAGRRFTASPRPERPRLGKRSTWVRWPRSPWAW